MPFRIATLNIEQNHKRWELRRELIVNQLGELRPDVMALNEICIPLQTARWVKEACSQRFGMEFALVQQSKAGVSSQFQGEGVLTQLPVVETSNLDFRTPDDGVAMMARLQTEGRILDVYVTHLYMSRGNDSLRLYQVEQLLDWINSHSGADGIAVCGDFNATLEMASAQLMTTMFRPTQAQPTAFTPLKDDDVAASHPYWPRLDRCIDYIWVSESLEITSSGVCFSLPDEDDPTLWPSDHIGVWADLRFA